MEFTATISGTMYLDLDDMKHLLDADCQVDREKILGSLVQDNFSAMSFDRISFGEVDSWHGSQIAGIDLNEESEEAVTELAGLDGASA